MQKWLKKITKTQQKTAAKQPVYKHRSVEKDDAAKEAAKADESKKKAVENNKKAKEKKRYDRDR